MLSLQQQTQPASNYDMVLEGDEDGLNELEKLAGINSAAKVVDQLVISDDELPDDLAADEEEDSDRPNSVGAESSYSDFMQQWKNKLMTDEEKE